MKWERLYIEGLGAYMPSGIEFTRDMVASGKFPTVEQEKTRQRSVAISNPDSGETAPEMAVEAARLAIAECAKAEIDISLLVHAVVLHNGLEAWNCGAFIQDNLGLENCTPIEIRVACAGAIVGMELTGRWFNGHGRGLVTASDSWTLPLFDRWNSDNGLVYGDAGAAAVVGPSPGPFRIHSTSLVTDPRLEKMHRGQSPLDMSSYSSDGPLDLTARVGEFAKERSVDEFWTRNARAVSECADTALRDAGIKKSDIKKWIVPNFGSVLLRKQCFEPLGITAEQTLAHDGFEIGHTGAADPLLGLQILRRKRELNPGDHVMLVGIGVGFTWGCAVIEYTGFTKEEADND